MDETVPDSVLECRGDLARRLERVLAGILPARMRDLWRLLRAGAPR